MITFIEWVLALIDAGESVTGLRVRLNMLLNVFAVVTSRYEREEIIAALAAEKRAADNA